MEPVQAMLLAGFDVYMGLLEIPETTKKTSMCAKWRIQLGTSPNVSLCFQIIIHENVWKHYRNGSKSNKVKGHENCSM